MPFAERLIHQSPGSFGVPVIDTCEDAEHDSADKHIVKMRDHEIRVMELPVPWRHREHDPGQAGDQELKEEANAEQHRCRKAYPAAPQSSDPIEYLDSGWDSDKHRGKSEEGIRDRGHADGKHVVSPHAETDKHDAYRSRDHRWVAENRLTAKDRDNLVCNRECRKHQDVDFGMTEDPEEMDPDQR